MWMQRTLSVPMTSPNVCGNDSGAGSNVRMLNPQESSRKWILEVDGPESNCTGISPWRLPPTTRNWSSTCSASTMRRFLKWCETYERKVEEAQPPFDLGGNSRDTRLFLNFKPSWDGGEIAVCPHPSDLESSMLGKDCQKYLTRVKVWCQGCKQPLRA